jgi:hypothetical protein
MELRTDQVVLVRLGFASLLLGLVALAWELLARQAPYTAASISTLEAPVAQLRVASFTGGLVVLAVAWLAPWFAPKPLCRRWLIFACGSTAFMLGALVMCAAFNVTGLQLAEPESGVRMLVRARVGSQVLVGLVLLDVAIRVFRRPQTWTPGGSASEAASLVPRDPQRNADRLAPDEESE